MGLNRLQEALEAYEWEGGADGSGSEDFQLEDEEQDGLDDVITEAERDGAGLRRALLLDNQEGDGLGDTENEGEDIKVEELEKMMAKMRAVKGTSSTNVSVYSTCYCL